MFERFLLVAAGGAVGSVMRYAAALLFGAAPWTTFWVNVSGSFLIGILAAVSSPGDMRLRLLLGTGVLGGYTTFSAWQLEAFIALRGQDLAAAVAILLGSLLSGFAAVAAGFLLASKLG